MMTPADLVTINMFFRAQRIHLSTEIVSSYGMKRIHVDHEMDPLQTEKTSTRHSVSN
nr:hypothetical protein 220p1_00051 [Serratia entomophila]